MNRVEAAPTAVKNLGKWLRENLYHVKEGHPEARFNRIVVRQVVKGTKTAEEVLSVDVPTKAKEDWAENAALDIYTRLQAEAAVLTGYQRYFLYAYFSDDMTTHLSRYPVGIQGDDDEDGFESEGTDKDGMRSQQMRHNEILAKIIASQSMTVMSAQNALITRLTNLAEGLLDKRTESLDMVEELVMAKGEQEIKMVKEAARAETLRDVGKRVSNLLVPAIANKIAGGDATVIKQNALMVMTKGILSSLMGNEERMQKFMASLSPEEQVAVMNLYEELSKTNEDGSANATDSNGTKS